MKFALPLALTLIYATNATADVLVIVTDKHTDRGLSAEVFFSHDGQTPVRLAETEPPDGKINLEISCSMTDRIVINPPEDYQDDKIERLCTVSPVHFKLQSIWVVQNMKKLARDYESAGEYGLASQAWNEAYWATKSDEARTASLSAAAKALNIPASTALVRDPKQQGRLVASSQFVEALKAYQEENSLPAGGVLDAHTLAELAGGSSWTNVLGPAHAMPLMQ